MSFGARPYEYEPPSRKPPVSRTVVILVAIGIAAIFYSVRQGRLTGESLLIFALLIPAIIIHEVSHGVVALWFGDSTAKNAGRLTLNPLRHVDSFGTIILPAILILVSAPPLGYAKPVPVNVGGMTRNKAMFTSLAGPAVNVVMMLMAVALVRSLGFAMPDLLVRILVLFGFVNVILAVFNSIPIPPLDGSAVIERFLPDRYMNGYLKFRKYSILLFLLLFLLGGNLFSDFISPFVRAYSSLY